MVEANVEMYKKLVTYYESLSHTLKGKTLLYYPQYWVILMFWEINEELQFSVLVRKPVAVNSQITSSHGNIGLNLLLPFNILTNLQGAARFTFSCLSHLVSYEMAKHWAKKEKE